MKYEIKLELKKDFIEKSIVDTYFNNDLLYKGTISKSPSPIIIKYTDNEYEILKGLTNGICKVFNEELIDGSMKCIIEENEDIINLIPCSLFCIFEDKKYSFY